jgi:hypothetical protein
VEHEILRSAEERFSQDDNDFLCFPQPRALSGGVVVLFVVDPFANEAWAGDYAEGAVLTVAQIGKGGAVQFFQVRQVEQRPQAAFFRGVNHLIEVVEVSFKQFSGNANGDAGSDLGEGLSVIGISVMLISVMHVWLMHDSP